MTSPRGFTDRTGLDDRGLGDSGGAVAPDGNLPVTLLLNLLLDDPGKAAILVGDTAMNGVTAWLPRKHLSIFGAGRSEPFALAQANRAGQRGRTIRVTMPLWLARSKNLATDAGAGQGNLF